MTPHNNHLHDHAADDEAKTALMIEACQKHLLENFDWLERSSEVIERVSPKSFDRAIGEFKKGNGLILSVLLDEEAELITLRTAKRMVSMYGKDWLIGLNGEIEE